MRRWVLVWMVLIGAALTACEVDDPPLPQCEEGVECGPACIASTETCTDDRRRSYSRTCTEPPCCFVGHPCGDRCCACQGDCW